MAGWATFFSIHCCIVLKHIKLCISEHILRPIDSGPSYVLVGSYWLFKSLMGVATHDSLFQTRLLNLLAIGNILSLCVRYMQKLVTQKFSFYSVVQYIYSKRGWIQISH